MGLAKRGRDSWAPSSWPGDGFVITFWAPALGREAKETKLGELPAWRMCTFEGTQGWEREEC